MFQDEGASTDVTGIRLSSKARITAGKGSRTSPENENPEKCEQEEGIGREENIPNMASITWSVSFRAVGKSSVNGIFKFRSWVERR